MSEANQSTELAVPHDGVGSEGANQEQRSGFLGSLGGVDVLRQATLVLALAICFIIAIFIVLWAMEPDYRPLGKYETDELIKTLDFLDQKQIDYNLKANVIEVPEDQYQSIKLQLAREGLDEASDPGTDILMKDMGFGVSQRMERERLNYSRESQLARTIEELQDITRAKVLLAIPKENVFARREKKPSATVVITLKRGRTLTGEEVDSIVDIVASAVNNLEPNRVTITDQNGRLLNSGSQDAASARSRKEYEIENTREQEYMEKIDTIMMPIVGIGNYTAQVDVEMDFSVNEETQKRFNPDLPAVRSEMTIEDNTVGGVTSGIPGALSNQPPLDSNIPEQANGEGSQSVTPGRNRKEATRNYELDTTISHTRSQSGVIKRVSVSVAVDYDTVPNDAGDLVREPRSQEMLLNIRRLLQGGIGFDVQRGDVLEVVTIPFNRVDTGENIEKSLFEQAWFIKVARLAIGALIIIVLLLAVVNPMLKKLIYPEETQEEYDETSFTTGLDLGDDSLDMLSPDFDESAVGFAADGTLQLPDLHGDDDLLKAVRALVANEPELSSQVVKAWLSEDD